MRVFAKASGARASRYFSLHRRCVVKFFNYHQNDSTGIACSVRAPRYCIMKLIFFLVYLLYYLRSLEAVGITKVQKGAPVLITVLPSHW